VVFIEMDENGVGVAAGVFQKQYIQLQHQ
jgi:hypothetical protein